VDTLRRDSVGGVGDMPGVWFTVPVGTLILPHYAFEAQIFLPCLFSLDILVRMCASLALKNLTELRAMRRNNIVYLSFIFHCNA